MDVHGNPIKFIVGDGTTHDLKIAPKLLDSLDLESITILCFDKGYDSKKRRDRIITTDTKANIPKKSNTKFDKDHMDWHLYKIRHLVENALARLKQNYENSFALACTFIWLLL